MRAITRIITTLKTAGFWLGTVQGLLALLFLFSGRFKACAPRGQMQMPFPFPEWFIRFLGVAELTGAIGLVLPSLLRIKPRLTPVAASCLTIIMAGATVVTFLAMGLAMAAMPLVIGML